MVRMSHLSRLLLLLIAAIHQQSLAHPGADAAINHFTEQIQLHPEAQSLYLQRGIAYSNDGQYNKALADLGLASKLGDPINVCFDLGVVYYRQGELDLALRYINQRLSRFPADAAALEYRARVSRDRGDAATAIADFRRVFELEERPNPGHYVSAAELLVSSGPDGIPQALAILDSGNDKLGLTPQLQYSAIELERRRGRTDLAVERMSSLQAILGDSPDWKVSMAELRLENGDVTQAAALLNEAISHLESLRKTPARLDLMSQISALKAGLGS